MAGSAARRHNIAHPCPAPSSSLATPESNQQQPPASQANATPVSSTINSHSTNNNLQYITITQQQQPPPQYSIGTATQHPSSSSPQHEAAMVTAEHHHQQQQQQQIHQAHPLQLQLQDQYQYPHHPRFTQAHRPPAPSQAGPPSDRQHVVSICMDYDDDDAAADRLRSASFQTSNCENGSGRPSSRQSNKNHHHHSITSQTAHHHRPLSIRSTAPDMDLQHSAHQPLQPQQQHLRQRHDQASNNALSSTDADGDGGDDAAAAEDDDDEDDPSGRQSKRVRHRRHRRPLYRRLFSYMRSAWTAGVNFSTSNDSETEELDTPIRYRPDSLSALCRTTRFTEAEIKRIYRGFKAECPSGVVKEDTFKLIYAQFFPQGANTGLYAHYVFNTLDQDRSGIVSFEEFVHGLSTLSRGSVEEKLQWTFALYDINGDGFITRDEMTDIVTAIYELMGRHPDSTGPDMEKIKDKVESIFLKMDTNGDGVVTLDEFVECCRTDDAISKSINVFDSSF